MLIRSYRKPKRAIRVSLLVLALLFALVPEALATPTNFVWVSYDDGINPNPGVRDSLGVPLAPGDCIQLIYAGANGIIDPIGYDGMPTGDDQLLQSSTIQDDLGQFYEIFSFDSLSWPTGTVVYVRAFNGPAAGPASEYGNSSLHPLVQFEEYNWPGWQTGGVTSVVLDYFTALPSDTSILVQWATSSELDTTGFNLLRSEAVDGTYTQINPDPIPAQGGPTLPASYSFEDATVTGGVTYYYKLQAIGSSGQQEALYGPVSAIAGGSRVYLPLVIK
jgi:hypothetical protein